MSRNRGPISRHHRASGASEHASIWLDGLRGVAALGVFASYWRDCLFQDYSQLRIHNPLLATVYFVTGRGING